MTETLNIDYHVSRLVLKALNLTDGNVAAAELLGVNCQMLICLKKRYSIIWDRDSGKYIFEQQKRKLNDKIRTAPKGHL